MFLQEMERSDTAPPSRHLLWGLHQSRCSRGRSRGRAVLEHWVLLGRAGHRLFGNSACAISRW